MEEAKGFKGRGSGINTHNRFLKNQYVEEHIEGLDEPLLSDQKTRYYEENPKKVVNEVTSPDIGMEFSLNPYQGCEHGCIYCYARNTHEYWGFSAGLDFERNIIIKKNAAELLEKHLNGRNYKPGVISMSGNTDCYQPIERKLGLTRKCLEVMAKYRNPVGIISKNSLILRDLDILQDLAKDNLVHVMISVTTLQEDLRQKLEPRTATAKNRLKVIETLNTHNIPCGVMVAPIIPGLNSMEIPSILEAAGKAGAVAAGYTIVRLNGKVADIFHEWLERSFPDAAQKVWHQIQEAHGGAVNDSRFGTRMKGEGNHAQAIKQIFSLAKKKWIREFSFDYNKEAFRKPPSGQLNLF